MRGLTVIAVAVTLGAALVAGVARADSLPGTKTAKDRAAWRAILHWPASCEQDWRATNIPDLAGVSLWPSAGGRRLVEVTCYFGAYQGVSMLYLLHPGPRPVGPLALRIYVDTGNGKATARSLTKILGILNFTPRTGRLVVFDKARGIGDCGFYSVFKLVGDGLVPVEARAKTKCDGKSGGGPEHWPKLPLP